MRRGDGLGRSTYAHNLVRNLLGLSLTFLEVRSTPIELSGVYLFIERSLNTKQLFVRRKLIPTNTAGAGTKGHIVTVCAEGYGGRSIGRVRGIGSPSSQLPFLPRTGFVTYISVGLEG